MRYSPRALHDLPGFPSHGWQCRRPTELLRTLRGADDQWQGISVSKDDGNRTDDATAVGLGAQLQCVVSSCVSSLTTSARPSLSATPRARLDHPSSSDLRTQGALRLLCSRSANTQQRSEILLVKMTPDIPPEAGPPCERRINALMDRDEVDPQRAELLQCVDELPQTSCESVVAIRPRRHPQVVSDS